MTNEAGHLFHIYTSQNRDPRKHPEIYENLTDGRLVIEYQIEAIDFPCRKYINKNQAQNLFPLTEDSSTT